MRETSVQSLGWEDPLEKGKATHSSILAWRIPCTVQSMGLQRVGHDFDFHLEMSCQELLDWWTHGNVGESSTFRERGSSVPPPTYLTLCLASVWPFLSWLLVLLDHWRRKWLTTPVFLPGESHGQRSLADYSPWGHKSWTRLSAQTTTTWSGLPWWLRLQRICLLMQETQGSTLDRPRKISWNGMATHSSILAWRIPWTEDPGWIQSMGSQRVGHNWVTLFFSSGS